jgi:probable biosynthetic protein (TIGR04099 family)
MLNELTPQVRLKASFLASMSNLAHTGLSENWLLKECGHQHWMALAALYDRDLPDFRDAQGRIAYAAFTQMKSQGLQLQSVCENRVFTLDTHLDRTAHNRHASEHRLLLGERCVGRINLVSTFVSRHVPGDNRSVAKACLRDAPEVAIVPSAEVQAQHRLGKRLRTGDWGSYFQLQKTRCHLLPTYCFSPCPDVDYNGAELFYFANFQAVTERAEWQLLGLRRPGQVRQREIYYYGNLDIDDTLLVHLRTPSPAQHSRHWCEIVRQSDGFKLADVFTEKVWPSECARP